MNTLKRSDEFHTWLTGLKDGQGRARILRRLANAQAGNFGDCEPVGDGVSEMRIHTGSGYRVYFVRWGETLYLLLCGGDKSTQKRDIDRARQMAEQIKET
jgi:putative addiction module killer protein